MPWTSTFPEPINLPDGGKLRTLMDAGQYVCKLPKTEADQQVWQNAMHVLTQAADDNGPVEFARLAMMQALWPKGTPVYRARDPKWRKNSIRADR